MSLTRFAVYRPKYDEWWRGGNRWSRSEAAARSFESEQLAERAALREVPDPRADWIVKPIHGGRHDA